MGKLHPQVYILGITGSIGSGKSTVLEILGNLGAFTIESDRLAKRYTEQDSPIRKEIIQIFGKEAYPNEDGPANRAYIASVAFQNPEKKNALEKLIHPLVRKDFLNIIQDLSQKESHPSKIALTPRNEKIVAWEVPLLFETDAYTLCDATLTVYVSQNTAWERVEKRGGISKEDFTNRWNQQFDVEKKKSLSDFALSNDNSKEELINKIHKIWNQITKGD